MSLVSQNGQIGRNDGSAMRPMLSGNQIKEEGTITDDEATRKALAKGER